jgi:hypothetical protein
MESPGQSTAKYGIRSLKALPPPRPKRKVQTKKLLLTVGEKEQTERKEILIAGARAPGRQTSRHKHELQERRTGLVA